jgi:hypothetical protein
VWGGVEGGVEGSWVYWVLYFARTSKFHDPLHLRHVMAVPVQIVLEPFELLVRTHNYAGAEKA